MDLDPIRGKPKPIIPDDLVKEIAGILGIDDPIKPCFLRTRLQRYSDRYIHGLQRAKILIDGGAARKQMAAIATQVRKLQGQLHGIEVIDDVGRGYKAFNRVSGGEGCTSLASLRRELTVLRQIAEAIASSKPLKAGSKGHPVLKRAVGSLMALFERLTGRRACRATSRNSIEGSFLVGAEAEAVGKFFAVVDPRVQEKSIANAIAALTKQFDGQPMSEGIFDLTSRLEDVGEIAVVYLAKPLGQKNSQ
jgi:hypothetical protein